MTINGSKTLDEIFAELEHQEITIKREYLVDLLFAARYYEPSTEDFGKSLKAARLEAEKLLS